MVFPTFLPINASQKHAYNKLNASVNVKGVGLHYINSCIEKGDSGFISPLLCSNFFVVVELGLAFDRTERYEPANARYVAAQISRNGFLRFGFLG
jgi:hypothetical protein